MSRPRSRVVSTPSIGTVHDRPSASNVSDIFTDS
jgi:hypothetical protein